MPKGINISVASDTRDFKSGVKQGIIEPLEDAEDRLKDIARTGDKTGDELERTMHEQQKATSDLRDEYDELGQQIRDTGKRSASDFHEATEQIRADTARIEASTRENVEGAGDVTGEFKEEAISNFSEVTSSFTGDMQSITDLAQGTFGGLASLGGPASLVFGGLAVAVGLVGQALATSNEQSDEFKEKIAGLAQTRLGDLLGQYSDSGDALARGLRNWATDADSFGGSLDDLQDNTRKGGLEFGKYAQAIATQNIPKMQQLRREVEAQIDSLDRQAGAQRAAGNGSSALANKLGEQSDAAHAVKDQLDQNLEVNDKYEASLRGVAKAQGVTVEQYKAMLDAQQQSQAATEDYADSVQSAFADAGSAVEDYVEDGVFNLDKYQQATQKNLDAIVGYQKNMSDAQGVLAKSGHDTALQYLEQLGPDAAPLIDAFVKAPAAKQNELAAIWDRLGATSAESYGTKLQSDLDARPTTKTVVVDADTGPYQAKVDALVRQTITKTIDVLANSFGDTPGRRRP